MDAHCRMILDEYNENKKSYLILRDVVIRLLKNIIKENGLLVTGVEGRVKEEDSLAKKLELKGHKYNTIADITDIVGCRVITFYSDEVDTISALVESIFTIDWENSIDKRKMHKQDQFGYMSLHYICTLPKKVYSDPKRPELNEIKFEIQMRTALQHVWATIYHDIGYKSDVEVPKEYLRSLSRLAGLIEIADEEFKSIRIDIEQYRKKVKELIKDGEFDDIDLNGDSFRNFLEVKPFEKINKSIASINRAEIQPVDMYNYLEILMYLGMENLGDIIRFRNDYYEDAYRLAKHQLAGKDIDIISESIGLQHLCIVYILKNGGGVFGLRKFYDLLNGEKPRNQRSAERLLKQAQEIGLIQ